MKDYELGARIALTGNLVKFDSIITEAYVL